MCVWRTAHRDFSRVYLRQTYSTRCSRTFIPGFDVQTSAPDGFSDRMTITLIIKLGHPFYMIAVFSTILFHFPCFRNSTYPSHGCNYLFLCAVCLCPMFLDHVAKSIWYTMKHLISWGHFLLFALMTIC